MDFKQIITGIVVGAVLALSSVFFLFQERISKLEARKRDQISNKQIANKTKITTKNRSYSGKVSASFIHNKLYNSHQCPDTHKLLVQTFEINGLDINNLIWVSHSIKWPDVTTSPANISIEKIKYKDPENNWAVRITCLNNMVNTERKSVFRFIDTVTGKTSDNIEVTEKALEITAGSPDYIKI